MKALTRKLIFAVLLAGFVLSSSGCSRLVAVEGEVRLDGKPLDCAMVQFLPEQQPASPGGPRSAQTVTDEQGRFQLNTGNYPGGMPGKYKVTVSKMKYPPEYHQADPLVVGMARMNALASQGKQLVPKRYIDQATTPLRIEIPKRGTKELIIEVRSDAGTEP